jgi:multiple sugar transport system permease protein
MDAIKINRIKRRADGVFSWVTGLIIIIFCIGPLLWIFATSFKPLGAEFRTPIELWPSEPSLQAYRTVLFQLKFFEPIINSFIVSASITVIGLFIAALSAYAIARLRIDYKIQSLFLLQIGAMIPPVVTIAPTFVIIRSLGLLSTLPGLILPHIFYMTPIATWLLATYFSEIPFELDDTARIDGCTTFQIFWKIILPLGAPGLFSAGIFAFLGSWGEFMLASAITMGVKGVQTVPVAILNFSFEHRMQWTWISAGIVLSLIPILLLVIIFQKKVIAGLTAGAVKF